MKQYITIFLYVFIYSFLMYPQAPDTLWTRVYGSSSYEGGYSVQQTSDGGYIIAANKGGGWLIKTDSIGNTLWSKTISGGVPFCIKLTSDHGYIIAYGINGHALMIKTDSLGNQEWTITGGGYRSYGKSVQQTPDGGYILAGTIEQHYNEWQNAYLFKSDPNGNLIWSKIYGGNRLDLIYSVNNTDDGGFIISGLTYSFGTEHSAVYLIKTDSVGNLLWEKSFGGETSLVSGRDVKQTDDGGYIIAGSVEYTGGGGDVLLIKTDEYGNMDWLNTIGGSSYDWGRSIQQTNDGGFIVTGTTASFSAIQVDVFIVKTTRYGNPVWSNNYGGYFNDGGREIQITSDGGYIVVGYTDSFGSGGEDVFLLKFEPDFTVGITEEYRSSDFLLTQNYPNPFNPTTTINYQLQELSFVTIKVYDVLGNEVATLVNVEKPAGSYEVEFTINNLQLSSGIYFYQLRVYPAGGGAGDPKSSLGQGFVETKKMVFLK